MLNVVLKDVEVGYSVLDELWADQCSGSFPEFAIGAEDTVAQELVP